MDNNKILHERKNQYEYISWLNVISAISVVILHANGRFWSYRTDPSWIMNNAVECIFYFAVPVFFMITGVTLLDYPEKYDTKTFFKKRFSKAGIPFLFWSSFAIGLKLVFNLKNVIENELSFDKILHGVFKTEYLHVYWFFIPLFLIYLSLPLFANVMKEKKTADIQLPCLCCFSHHFYIAFFDKAFKRFIRMGY